MRLLEKERLRAPLIALGVFAVAMAARLLWVAYVDSPFDNIFSDMRGYIERAHQAAYGTGDPNPAFATYYPPGAHLLYAAEMRLAGFDHHHGPMLVLNCAWGAVVAPCATLLAMRIVSRPWIAAAIGIVVALWYPLLAFAGFFSSEQPYAGAIALNTWLLVRLVERGKGGVALGVTAAIAYLVRPQIVLTLAALALLGLLIVLRGPLGRVWAALRFPRAPRLPLGRLLVAGAILTAAVAFGAVRYHALSGRWGLISDNGAMARFGADTSYATVRSTNGFFFTSPTKAENGEHRELLVNGYVGDPVVLERARRNEVFYMSTGDRIVRWLGNVRYLFVKNSMWPDASHQGTGWRREWYDLCHGVLLVVLCPLALVGMISCVRRPTLVPLVCSAHVLTMLVVAAFFCGEQRYRVPYDVFLVLLAVAGVRDLASYLVVMRRDGAAPEPSRSAPA